MTRTGPSQLGSEHAEGTVIQRASNHDARSWELIIRVSDEQTERLKRDDILENTTFCWLANTAISSPRLCWEYKGGTPGRLVGGESSRTEFIGPSAR